MSLREYLAEINIDTEPTKWKTPEIKKTSNSYMAFLSVF